jgi:hypothetical protein
MHISPCSLPCSGYESSESSHSYSTLNWQTQTSSTYLGEGENGSVKHSWAICSLTYALDYRDAVRAYSHEVRANAGAMQPCHYDMQEKGISFELVRKPCPCPRGNDNEGSATGSVTRDESMAKEIYAGENSTAETYEGFACFLDSHAEESASRTSGAEVVETVSAMMDGDGAGRMVGAPNDEWGFCCASLDVVCPPRAFSYAPSHVFLAPTFPSAPRAAFVLHPAVAHVLPFLLSAFVAAPPASLC